MNDFGKILVFLGLVLAGLGLILLYGPQIPWLGKLPGDITIKREHFTFYFPLGQFHCHQYSVNHSFFSVPPLTQSAPTPKERTCNISNGRYTE